VTDATVTARVLAPRQALSTLLSTLSAPAEPAGFQYEAGATPAQRKLQLLLGQDAFQAALRPVSSQISLQHTGGGTYEADYSGTTLTGPYTVIFRVEGQRADIGTYERTESRSVTVRFGRAVLSASGLRLASAEQTVGGFRYELVVRPVDARGNFLGPDYGHAITVTIDGTPVQDVTDRLDGSYVFSAVLPGPGDPVVSVTVMNEPLYDGPLSGIPTVRRPRVALSAHVGLAVPVTGFSSAANAGFLWELDLEYRATPFVSLDGVFGRYDFGPPGTITGGILYLKGYLGGGTVRFYGAAGPGVFKPAGASADIGVSGAIGLNLPLTGNLEFDIGPAYSHIFDGGGLGFLALRAGLKLAF
jgi:hypothetical protein